ncbi:hypothetical protein MBRA_04241 [Methylobacterium brachiatum]|nr:hypothetical protein MBRA_04241 [Methylobacterium brachiatum]
MVVAPTAQPAPERHRQGGDDRAGSAARIRVDTGEWFHAPGAVRGVDGRSGLRIALRVTHYANSVRCADGSCGPVGRPKAAFASGDVPMRRMPHDRAEATRGLSGSRATRRWLGLGKQLRLNLRRGKSLVTRDFAGLTGRTCGNIRSCQEARTHSRRLPVIAAFFADDVSASQAALLASSALDRRAADDDAPPSLMAGSGRIVEALPNALDAARVQGRHLMVALPLAHLGDRSIRSRVDVAVVSFGPRPLAASAALRAVAADALPDLPALVARLLRQRPSGRPARAAGDAGGPPAREGRPAARRRALRRPDVPLRRSRRRTVPRRGGPARAAPRSGSPQRAVR